MRALPVTPCFTYRLLLLLSSLFFLLLSGVVVRCELWRDDKNSKIVLQKAICNRCRERQTAVERQQGCMAVLVLQSSLKNPSGTEHTTPLTNRVILHACT